MMTWSLWVSIQCRDWRASAGALGQLPVARAASLARALKSYHDAGVFVAGLDGR